jgi:type I restriction enzyme, S subunit
MIRTIPNNWTTAQFDQVAEVITGSTPSTAIRAYYDGPIPFVTPADLDKCEPIEQAKSSLTELGAQQARLVPKGTVLVCCIGATIGKIGIAGRQVATNQQINSLVFDSSKVDYRYGYFYCQTLKDFIRQSGTSTTLPILNKSRFSKIEIPLPPLSEQRRIADILDKADTIRRKRKEAVEVAEGLITSAFIHMFGDVGNNPKSWPTATIGELTSLVTSGVTPRGGSTVYLEDGPYFIRSQNVLMNRLDLTHVACLPDDIHESMSRTKVFMGDVLLNITGASIGRVTWVESLDREANVNQHVCIIRPDTNKVAAPYVSVALSLPASQVMINRVQSGASRQGLNHQQVRSFELPVPPRNKQTEFEHIVQKIRLTSENAYLANTQSSVLFNTLVQRAFKGEL